MYEESIKPAIEESGLQCLRSDKSILSGENIISEIKGLIKEAIVLIADLTDNNQNVYYELGFAHGVGKKTVFLLSQSTNDLPFDIRHLQICEYKNTSEGRKKLRNDIAEYIKKLPEEGLDTYLDYLLGNLLFETIFED